MFLCASWTFLSASAIRELANSVDDERGNDDRKRIELESLAGKKLGWTGWIRNRANGNEFETRREGR
jgi:hypothetical protein